MCESHIADLRRICAKYSGKQKIILPTEANYSVVNYCIDTNSRYFGLSAADVWRLSSQLAIRNGLPHPFSHDEAAAEDK
jgi:hypothetical protein